MTPTQRVQEICKQGAEEMAASRSVHACFHRDRAILQYLDEEAIRREQFEEFVYRRLVEIGGAS